jgi:hypothetical protein
MKIYSSSLGSRRPMKAVSLCLVLLLGGCISASGQPEKVVSKGEPVSEEPTSRLAGLFNGILDAVKGVAKGQELPNKTLNDLSLSELEEMKTQALKDQRQGNECVDCVDDGEGNMLPAALVRSIQMQKSKTSVEEAQVSDDNGNDSSSHDQQSHDMMSNDDGGDSSDSSSLEEELTLDQVISNARSLNERESAPRVDHLHDSYKSYKTPGPRPTPSPADSCVQSGGEVTTALCCEAVGDFPNTCAIGACGCAPEFSKDTQVCSCPAGTCFDGRECVSTELPECVEAEIFFDEIGLNPGDYLSDQFEPFFGLTFSSTGDGALGDHPRIFDTSDPYKRVGGRVCGDKDLGAPNRECPGGGPGKGEGGEPGPNGSNPYKNCEPLGNALIIQEDNRKNVCGDIPDDNQEGGVLTMDFSPPANEFFDVSLLDVDYPVSITVTVVDDDGGLTEKPPIALPLTGDNSLQTVVLNEKNVAQLRFILRRSAAITSLRFCYTPPVIPTKPPTPSPTPRPSTPASKRPTPRPSPSPTPRPSPSPKPPTREPTVPATEEPEPPTPFPTEDKLDCEYYFDDWVDCVERRKGCRRRCDTSIPGDSDDFFTPGVDCETFFEWYDENESCCRRCSKFLWEFKDCKDCEDVPPSPTPRPPSPDTRKPTPRPTIRPTIRTSKPTPRPTPRECEDTKPRRDGYGEYFCDADCPGDAVCLPDETGRYCSCELPCEEQKPDKFGKCPGVIHVYAL